MIFGNDNMSYQIEKWQSVTEPRSRYKATVWCPACGLRIGITHEISDDGTLSPSLVCPHDGCDFHEWVQLTGWPTPPNE